MSDQSEKNYTHPSYIYDKCRPGMAETREEFDAFRKTREDFEKLLWNSLGKIGASITSGNMLSSDIDPAKDERTKGYPTVVHLYREDPPMTPKEAQEFGNELATGWAAIKLINKVPDFCDDVFALPKE